MLSDNQGARKETSTYMCWLQHFTDEETEVPRDKNHTETPWDKGYLGWFVCTRETHLDKIRVKASGQEAQKGFRRPRLGMIKSLETEASYFHSLCLFPPGRSYLPLCSSVSLSLFSQPDFSLSMVGDANPVRCVLCWDEWWPWLTLVTTLQGQLSGSKDLIAQPGSGVSPWSNELWLTEQIHNQGQIQALMFIQFGEPTLRIDIKLPIQN